LIAVPGAQGAEQLPARLTRRDQRALDERVMFANSRRMSRW
jgi:hypothetical protein